ncbi:MAG: hypothetical protein DMG65_26795 [Candidatus Angelobacter sp. Gp1-AA117]|nr:MAG: hypothetical protein DMG65_26795 [Candidatus Angelobacter sp. Gp1-AA117]
MKKAAVLVVTIAAAAVFATLLTHQVPVSAATPNQPVYKADGKLTLPANYREWVFLTSGLGMNYSTGTGGPQLFTNVYVSPEAYREFKSSGKWPDKSMYVVEIYSPATHGSINKGGHYQNAYMGLDIEVKDSSRPQEWSYYNFNPGESMAAAFPAGNGCLKCHSENAAVDHTFVQFYPTLLDFAVGKNLIKPGVSIPLNLTRFQKIVLDSGWEKAEQAFYEDRKKNPESDLLDLHSLQMLAGYLENQNRAGDALKVMALATRQWPTLALPYEELAQRYRNASQPELSLETSRKELALLDSDSTLSDAQKKRLREMAEKRVAELSKK